MRAGLAALIGVVAALVLAQAASVSFPVRIGSTTLMRQSAPSASVAKPQGAVVCAMGDADTRWIQQGLEGWHQVSGFLQIDRTRLPWIVVFNTSCIWHLMAPDEAPAAAAATATTLSFAESPVAVRATPHADSIRLPNGSDIPTQPMAMASVYGERASAFFVMALPEVWRRDPRHARDPNLERFLLGVMTHEMVHTRHLPVIVEQAKALAACYKLGSLQLDDDVIQKRFEGIPGFKKAFEAERDMFFRAAGESDAGRRNALVARALSMARQRRARYFRGDDQMYGEFEDLFLSIEGAGQWAAYRFAKAQAGPAASDAATVIFVRDNRKYWSQEEGLALFLLLDAYVPDWQVRVFSPTLISPLALLEEVLRNGAQ